MDKTRNATVCIEVVNKEIIMKMKWHDDSEAFLLFGAELNKIIAALQYLSKKNSTSSKVKKFIEQLKNLRSYDELLDEVIMKSRGGKVMTKPSNGGAVDSGMSLDEILYRNDLKLPKDGDE